MLAGQRREKIKQKLLTNNKVKVSELSKTYAVSEVTIRKDLSILAKEGILEKIHGGAILKKDKKEIIVNDIKKKIAEKAYTLITSGESIFIGSGDTCYHLSKLIKKEDHVSVITNNISAVTHLQEVCHNLYLIGGETLIRNGLLFTASKDAKKYFDRLTINKAFTSSVALDKNLGITVEKELSTYIFEAMKEATNQWILMIDSTKFDNVGVYSVGRVEEISTIVSNKVPQKYLNVLREKTVDVLI